MASLHLIQIVMIAEPGHGGDEQVGRGGSMPGTYGVVSATRGCVKNPIRHKKCATGLVVEIRHLVPCFRLWTRKMPELAMCASAKQCPLYTR